MMTYSVRAQKPLSRRSQLAAFVFVVWLFVVPLASAEVTPDDGVVADVVKMLDAGIEPRLVRSWLESGGRSPGTLSANDMIALSSANASDELIEYLLETSARPAGAETPAAAPPPTSRPQEPASPEVMAPASSVVHEAPVVQSSARTDSSECCLVDFAVEYRSAEDSDSDDMEADAPDLFVYLDGEFLGRFASQGDIGSRGPLTFRRQLATGSHSIRLTRERHTPSKSRKKSGTWDHATTVSPSVIRFNVEPGANWNLDIRWTESVFSLKPPLHWRWSRDGVEVAGEKNAGAFRDDWPYLCDDIEIKPRIRRYIGVARERSQQELRHVGVAVAGKRSTTRAQILDELRADQFKPNIGATGRIN